MLNRITTALVFFMLATNATVAMAADYVIDTKGAHASINFRIKHLGYSWLVGRFDKFSGSFTFDEDNLNKSTVSVAIDTTSVNSNHNLRDKHLRSQDFLNTDRYPKASFNSKRVEVKSRTKGVIYGDLTLRGVTREVAIDAQFVGGGKDPWGGHRVGFTGESKILLSDFNIPTKLGPESREVLLSFEVEGIKKR